MQKQVGPCFSFWDFIWDSLVDSEDLALLVSFIPPPPRFFHLFWISWTLGERFDGDLPFILCLCLMFGCGPLHLSPYAVKYSFSDDGIRHRSVTIAEDQAISCFQARLPVSGLGCFQLSFCPMGSHWNLQTTQAVAKTKGCSLQGDSEGLSVEDNTHTVRWT